jgi:BirA family biotin operon repressor/biotin-[acetyl-CoA-carboxylase] ligase
MNMSLLNKISILEYINNKHIQIHLFNSISSTNNAFHCLESTESIHVCLAEEQTQGRGQQERPWHSPSNQNIYLSLCYFSSKAVAQLAPLSLVIGISLCEFLNLYLKKKDWIQIKWPNDILCQNKKLAGILIETKKKENLYQLIIGIGLNVNMELDKENKISQPWTSLKQLTKKNHDRNQLAGYLINKLEESIYLFEKKDFSFFIPTWNKYNLFKNKMVSIQQGEKILYGKCIGIAENGALALEMQNGELQYFLSGEAKLKLCNL